MFDQEQYDPTISHRPGFIVIPKIFHSLYDGPFKSCLMCTRELLRAETPYTIQRSFANDEPICEFALCAVCGDQLRSELSAESIERIESYFHERINLEGRTVDLLRRAFTSVELWLEECLITKKPRNQCTTRIIYGDFEGRLLKFGSKPYMICGEVSQQIESLYSKQTRERLDDFVDDFLGMPPEFLEAPDHPRLILV